MDILRQLFHSTELLQYFAGTVATTASTKKYAASGIGSGFAVGDLIYVTGFSNTDSNGYKTIATIASDNSYITVDEAIGDDETGISGVFNQAVRSGWISIRAFARIVGALYAVGGSGVYLVEYAADENGDVLYMPNSSGEAWTTATYAAFSYEVVAPYMRVTFRNNGTDQTTFRAWVGGRTMS
jgi:hypothetical protein